MLVVSLVICCGVIITTKNIRLNSQVVEEEKIARGLETLKKLEKQDIVEIEERIDAARLNEDSFENIELDKVDTSTDINASSTQTNDEKNYNYNKKFSKSVIVGDSRAEGISAYGYLNKSSVVAYKGRNIASAKKNGDIDKAIGLYPKNMFFTYGVNDIECYSDSSIFIKQYKSVINQVKSKLPKTKIYVCSILPVRQDAINKQPNFNNLKEFNSELKKMCDDMDIIYLDANPIVLQSDYEPDGIHFIGSFQKKWLNFFIEEAKL